MALWREEREEKKEKEEEEEEVFSLLIKVNLLLCDLFHLNNKPKECLSHAENAFQLAEKERKSLDENLFKICGRKFCLAQLNFTSIFNSFTENSLALPHLERAVHAAEDCGYEEGKYSSFLQIGLAHKKLKSLESSLQFLENAKKLLSEKKVERSKEEEATLANEIGEIYLRKNDLEKAKLFFSEAKEKTEKTVQMSTFLTAFNNLALVAILENKTEAAKRYLHKIVDVATSCQEHYNLAIAHKRLSILYDKEGDSFHYKKHSIAADSIQKDIGTQIYDKEGNPVEIEYS